MVPPGARSSGASTGVPYETGPIGGASLQMHGVSHPIPRGMVQASRSSRELATLLRRGGYFAACAGLFLAEGGLWGSWP